MTVELLSRIQFAFSVSFHYIYPPLSIGLSFALIIMELMYLRTGSKHWEAMTKFWLRVFALTFALGVATGIPLQFTLGTNWGRFSYFVGDIFGSALAAEGVFAFGMEAGFLGILLFGWNRVSKKLHFLSTVAVAVGAHFSAFWIVAANSWMHTPSGYALAQDADGVTVARLTNWFEMIFNPSTIDHIIHVILSCWITGASLIVSVSAYYLLKKRHLEFAKSSLRIGIGILLISSILQLFAADSLAGTIAKNNPEKFAAFEGVFETHPYTEAYAFGWVDMEKQETHGLAIPGLLSFLVHRDLREPVQGLKDFPQEHWPNVPVVFQVYHLMIFCWGLIFLAGLLGAHIWWHNQWNRPRWMLRYLVAAVVIPQVASLAGWCSSCLGRQPWVVYKLMERKEGLSHGITYGETLTSLILFVLVYLTFLVLFLVLLDQKIKHGPALSEEHLPYRDSYEKEDPHA